MYITSKLVLHFIPIVLFHVLNLLTIDPHMTQQLASCQFVRKLLADSCHVETMYIPYTVHSYKAVGKIFVYLIFQKNVFKLPIMLNVSIENLFYLHA